MFGIDGSHSHPQDCLRSQTFLAALHVYDLYRQRSVLMGSRGQTFLTNSKT